MSVNIEWNIQSLKVLPVFENLTNILTTVQFSITGKNPPPWGNLVLHRIVQLGKPTNGFTEFDALTEAQVVSWVKDMLGPVNVASLEAQVFHGALAMRNVIFADQLTTGTYYTITSTGTSDFTLVGAEANTVNSSFYAAGSTTGTGTVTTGPSITTVPLPWA
jgi:hypothetical protein